MTDDASRQQATAAFDDVRLSAAQTSRAVQAVERTQDTLAHLASAALDQIEATRRFAEQVSTDSAAIAANSGGISRETAQLTANLQAVQSWANSFDVRIDTATRDVLRSEIDAVVDDLKKHTNRLEQSAEEMSSKVANLEQDLESRRSTSWSNSSLFLIAAAFVVGVLVGSAGGAAIVVVALTAAAAGGFWYYTTQRRTP